MPAKKQNVEAPKIKKLGLLCSGGDAPGMNPCIRAVVRAADAMGIEVIGFRYGYKGLLEPNMFRMDLRTVGNIIMEPGTILHSSRCNGFKSPDRVKQAVELCRENGIEGLVVLGGDGSFKGARDLSNSGINCIGIPNTIDNDISSTEYTIGYDTALNTVIHQVDCVRATSDSHYRCCVIETMGNTAGYLALYGGIAVGATAILIPEKAIDLQRDLIEPLKAARDSGKKSFIVMVAEGIFTQQFNKLPKYKKYGIKNVQDMVKYIYTETKEEIVLEDFADMPVDAVVSQIMKIENKTEYGFTLRQFISVNKNKKTVNVPELVAYIKAEHTKVKEIGIDVTVETRDGKTVLIIPGIDTRHTVLGHVQRGGIPTEKDRLAASQMGEHAVKLLAQGLGNRVVAIKNNRVVDYEINKALKMKKKINLRDLEMNKNLSR